jgi:hypothetical protein
MLEELFFHEKVSLVIEHFVIHEKWEQNKKDLCEILEIYPKLMRKILDKLVEFKLIKVTRKIARSKFYKLNNQSELIPHLRGLIQDLSIQKSLEFAKTQEDEKKDEKKKYKEKNVRINE